jgi:hypothetical protein
MAGLQEPAFGEADDGVAGDEQVVEDTDVDESERIAQTVGEELVGLRRLGRERAWE